jgi:hypothetical protein
MNSEDLEKLNLVSRELQRKDNLRALQAAPPRPGGIVGGRPDGTMAPYSGLVELVRNSINDARNIIDNFEKSTIELESKVAQLSAQLDNERHARRELEKMMAQIVELVERK